MKRTEMLNEIHNLLRSEDLIGTSYYDVADMVLKLIEEKGMAPPVYFQELNPRLDDGFRLVAKWEEE